MVKFKGDCPIFDVGFSALLFLILKVKGNNFVPKYKGEQKGFTGGLSKGNMKSKFSF